ncbi:hypothetical protein BXZ70DRAFT_914197 [Cristinia sonorae]|uniref:Uncharacterized protein n=1 Tax=Cristinia sonorae TaxID=1940300 RepID=A0A8K0V096_9AGAR|nr:hypothetical protein BXZ70DRAFT_914197 [Cristinia sonorae]
MGGAGGARIQWLALTGIVVGLGTHVWNQVHSDKTGGHDDVRGWNGRRASQSGPYFANPEREDERLDSTRHSPNSKVWYYIVGRQFTYLQLYHPHHFSILTVLLSGFQAFHFPCHTRTF